MTTPTKITLCDGKYEVIYDFGTGQSECLRHGEKWRDLCGDKMVLAMFDRIVELEAVLRVAKTALESADAYMENHHVWLHEALTDIKEVLK